MTFCSTRNLDDLPLTTTQYVVVAPPSASESVELLSEELLLLHRGVRGVRGDGGDDGAQGEVDAAAASFVAADL